MFIHLSQMYGIKDIGKNKAQKAKEIALEYGNSTYTALGRFDEDSPIDNIVFSCFDNMNARKILFDKWYSYQLSKTPEYREANPNEINIFIDSRMNIESMQVFFIKNKADAELYKTTLFEDIEVPDAPCSFKATCQTGTMIASIISIGFLNFVANKMKGIDIREIPFATTFNSPMMLFENYTRQQYANIHR